MAVDHRRADLDSPAPAREMPRAAGSASRSPQKGSRRWSGSAARSPGALTAGRLDIAERPLQRGRQRRHAAAGSPVALPLEKRRPKPDLKPRIWWLTADWSRRASAAQLKLPCRTTAFERRSAASGTYAIGLHDLAHASPKPSFDKGRPQASPSTSPDRRISGWTAPCSPAIAARTSPTNGPKVTPTFRPPDAAPPRRDPRAVMDRSRHRRPRSSPPTTTSATIPTSSTAPSARRWARRDARRFDLVGRHRRRSPASSFGGNVTIPTGAKGQLVRRRRPDRRRHAASASVRQCHPDTLLLKSEFPQMDFVDIAAAMRLRMVKSTRRNHHITEIARIADLGSAACVGRRASARPSTKSRSTRRRPWSARSQRHGRMPKSSTAGLVSSPASTPTAHNPSPRAGSTRDILSLLPDGRGLLSRSNAALFAETAAPENIRLWEINCAVHDRGKALLVPGSRCRDRAGLNEICRARPQIPVLRLAIQPGVLCHYYGRRANWNCARIATPNEHGRHGMMMRSDGLPGAGGTTAKHDPRVVTEGRQPQASGFPTARAPAVVR